MTWKGWPLSDLAEPAWQSRLGQTNQNKVPSSRLCFGSWYPRRPYTIDGSRVSPTYLASISYEVSACILVDDYHVQSDEHMGVSMADPTFISRSFADGTSAEFKGWITPPWLETIILQR